MTQTALNSTHDPRRRSWLGPANDPACEFPIQNLPFGVFVPRSAPALEPTIGVAIGDRVLDLRACARSGLLAPLAAATVHACGESALNPLMALGPAAWSPLRARLSDLLRADHPEAALHRRQLDSCLPGADSVQMLLPARIGDYTDFYASIFHATRVGSLFRPDHPLLPNYKYVPIGYHGRASSLAVSPVEFFRPSGQISPAPGQPPLFTPTRALDYELEMGFFAGPGNVLGEPVPIRQAGDCLFGCCLLNDWSARDVQAWEYQPLGPFLAKNFATTLSPWIVTMEALAPFRVPAMPRPEGDPAPLPYLLDAGDASHGAFDVTLDVFLASAAMRAAGLPPLRLSHGSLRDLYWTPAQMLAHHTSNGCNLQPGDLLATGTISGPDDGSRGCLLEITRRGTQPVALPSGESRAFLEDGDQVFFRASCCRDGFASIGFGPCSGLILPARR